MRQLYPTKDVKAWLEAYTGLSARDVKKRVPGVKDSRRALEVSGNRRELDYIPAPYRLASLELVALCTRQAYYQQDKKYPHPPECLEQAHPEKQVAEFIHALETNLPHIPQPHIPSYLSLAKKIAREDLHSARRFLEKAHHFSDVPQDGQPHLLESMHRLSEKHPETLSAIVYLSGYYLNEVYKEYVPCLIDVMTAFTETEGSDAVRGWSTLQQSINKIPFKHARAVFLGMKRIAQKRPDYLERLVKTMETTLERVHERETLSPDEFIIESIQDPKDAQALSPLIDRKTHRTAYARRIKLFYGKTL